MLRIVLVTLLFLTAGGCAPTPFTGQPIEQLTVRFNAGLMEHTGEYRLVRPLAQQNQCLWQLYVDGAFSTSGQIELPRDGLSAVFAEAAAVRGAAVLTSQPTTQTADLPESGVYVAHVTYQTPFDKQDTEFSGKLSQVARMMEQAGQIYAMHKIIVRKLPPTFWFAYLDQSRVRD